MTIQLYNSMTRKKEAFVPLEDGKVKIYVCGPTVYDMAHIGHARSCVAFDVIVRYLRRHYDVTYVRNYTDVDDKIIKRSIEEERPSIEVSEHYIAEFKTDMAALNNSVPDHEPKVTQTMDEIVTFVQNLIDKGHAYAAEGDVYFAVQSFDGYGKLSGRSLDDMEAGARVEVNDKKRHPMDFALWKAAKPGEPKWSSPWGEGRPGWHIECSAMSCQLLGMPFDIHGGGKDLIFPHHENEIAQSEAAHGGCYARHWMHNGFVTIDDEKMSKSLGNFFTVRDVNERFAGEVIRFYLLGTHYRSPINFSDAALQEAEARLKYIYETLGRLRGRAKNNVGIDGTLRSDAVGRVVAKFEDAMNDDFNTAKAVGDLSEIFKLINEILDQPREADEDARTLNAIEKAIDDVGGSLGLFQADPAVLLAELESKKQKDAQVDAARIDALVQERQDARASKNFARADEIRDELQAMGVVLKDQGGQTVWEIA